MNFDNKKEVKNHINFYVKLNKLYGIENLIEIFQIFHMVCDFLLVVSNL